MQTEAYASYRERCVQHDSLVKISAAAMHLLQGVSLTPGADAVIGALAVATGEPWNRDTRIPSPSRRVAHATGVLNNLHVATSVALFDDYLQHLLYDLYFTGTLTHNPSHILPSSVSHADPPVQWDCCAEAASEFCRQNGLSKRTERIAGLLRAKLAASVASVAASAAQAADLASLKMIEDAQQANCPTPPHLLVFHFFRALRNAILHEGGRANNEVALLSASPSFRKALRVMKEPDGAELPSVPQFEIGQPISLQPRHSVLASVVCRRVAKALDEYAVRLLHPNAVHQLSAFNALFFEHHHARRGVPRTVATACRGFISHRYRSPNSSDREIADGLRTLGLHLEAEKRVAVMRL